MSSQGEGSKTTPGFAPTASTAVPSSAAIAPRFVPGRTNTSVPGGASTSSSPSVNVPLVVLLDHPLARPGRVRVRAERTDPEPAPHRPPDELPLVDRQLLELVDVRDLVTLAHLALASLSDSSTTGSILSTPSNRSSRFSPPVQRRMASANSPS